jgi:hypothetical protein
VAGTAAVWMCSLPTAYAILPSHQQQCKHMCLVPHVSGDGGSTVLGSDDPGRMAAAWSDPGTADSSTSDTQHVGGPSGVWGRRNATPHNVGTDRRIAWSWIHPDGHGFLGVRTGCIGLVCNASASWRAQGGV